MNKKYVVSDEKYVVSAAVLDENNSLTGETVTIDLKNDIQPFPCSGGCGQTRAICLLISPACLDWICPNHDNRKGILCLRAGSITRLIKGKEPPKCPGCQENLIIYQNSFSHNG